MRLKLTTSRVHGSGRTETRGDVIEVTDAEGERLLAYGQAMRLDEAEAEINDGDESKPKRKRGRP